MTNARDAALTPDAFIASDRGDTARIGAPITLIQPRRGLFDLDLTTFWRYRGLLLVLVQRDLKVFYRQTAIGACWAIAQPVFTVAIFTVIFGYFAKLPTEGVPYVLFAATGVVLWIYFAEALRRSATSLVNEDELIRKVYFPRLIIPLAAVLSPMVDFGVAFAVLEALMLWHGMAPSWQTLLVVPIVLGTGALAFGISLWLGPTNVRFRDVKHTLPFLIQVWMYGSPVVYASSMVPETWRWLYYTNPIVGFIEIFRYAVLLKYHTDVASITMSVCATIILVATGLIFFGRTERSFADTI